MSARLNTSEGRPSDAIRTTRMKTRYRLALAAVLLVAAAFLLPRLTSSSERPGSAAANPPGGNPSQSGADSTSVASAARGLTNQASSADASIPTSPAAVSGRIPAGTLKPGHPAPSASADLPDDVVWTIQDASSSRNFVLALDEVWLRNGEEKGKAVPVQAASAAELEALVLSMEGEVFPVLYEAGRPRNEYTRRVVTPAVSIKLDDPAQAAAIAAAAGAASFEIPEYAADQAILSTPRGLAALRVAENLSNLDGVAWAEPQLARQYAKRQSWPPNDPLFTNQWHLRNTGQSNGVAGIDVGINVTNAAIITNGLTITNTNNPVWAAYRGTNVYIAITDDGLQVSHPDLTNNVDVNIDYDFNGGDNDPSPGTGDDHGTACAGVAAARGNNGIGVSGVAPEARLVGLRLISDLATAAQEAQAMNWSNSIIHINSNSWGPADDGDTIEGPTSTALAGITNAIANGRGGRGTIFTWAGGNGLQELDDSNFDGWANSIYTIAVGAADIRGQQAWYSEPGANLVVCAPSSGDNNAAAQVGITTTDRTGSVGYSTTDYANDFGGTSSATPKVSGVVALMLQANPNLGWRDVQEILIRTARRNHPTDAGWAQNGAGLWFNHKYGAGLVNARAAVDMAQAWSNLGPQLLRTATGTGGGATIPDNNATGVVHQFTIAPGDNIRVEHVRVSVNVTHPRRRDLRVELTSPSGTVSVLTTQAAGAAYTGTNLVWTLMSVRHWGENAAGTWALRVADRLTGASTGTRVSATPTLEVLGTSTDLINPPPVVTLTSPASDLIVSPGATVNLAATATDVDAGGSPGTVSQVEFLANGSVIHTDTTAPYTFAWSPALGIYSVSARATDSEAASATSGAVSVEVRNQIPVISSAQTSPSGNAFSDQPVTVTGVVASDPEGSSVNIAYQWQSTLNGSVWSNASGLTSATLPASPSNSSLLWRPLLTPNDGAQNGAVFTGPTVNVNNRPVTNATVGSAYNHQPGLYVPATTASFTRPVIINEFSQGPSGGTAEWVELLTLEDTNFASYRIADAAGNSLAFVNTSAWSNIPAGTAIIIYNGTSKDPLLPADDANPSDDKRMVIASTNATYFNQGSGSAWPGFGNNGDAVILSDSTNAVVAQIGYGNNTSASPNVGTVNGGRAVYYTGDTEQGITSGGNWQTTSSATARSARITRALGDLFFSEYVEGSSNNKALEIYNPSTSAVNLATAGYQVQDYANGTNAPTASIALTGTLQPGAVHVIANPGAVAGLLSLANQTNGSINFNGDDTIVLRKGGTNGTIVDVIGQIGFDPGAAWTNNGVSTVDRTLRRKASVVQGDTNATNAFDPSIEWDGFPIDTFSGLGSHSTSPGPVLSVAASPSSFAENAGTNASTGTVTIPSAVATNVPVTLSSGNTNAATVPASVTINAGATNATFPIAAVDNLISDGTKLVTISATASGYGGGQVQVSVTDNEPSLDGVTPGTGNSPANTQFIANLRAGAFSQPPLYRTGTGHQMPPGLALDPNTGVLAGTPTAAGTYNIVIERYNSLGEVSTQSYQLVVFAGGVSYDTWVAGYAGLSDTNRGADPERDGLANMAEYFMGLDPSLSDSGTAFARSGSSLVLDYRRSKTATGVTGAAKWHPDAVSATPWSTNGITDQFLSDHGSYEMRRATLPLAPGDNRKFLRLEVTQP